LPGNNGQSLQRRIEVAGRTWIVTASQKQSNALSTMGWLTAIFAAITSLLVLAIGQLVTRRAVADRNMVEFLSSQASIRDSLTRELNHRVKNTLANVLSIASLTRSRSNDIDEFHESLTARIRALSATHDLLSQSDWRSAPLGEVVRSELAPYMKGGEGHVTLSGPEIQLAPNDAMSLGLAIHELATNAAKYGALTTANGSIAVEWDIADEGVAVIHWREAGGPPVSEPTSRGFGRDLIEKVVAHELGSQVNLEFKPTGVECTLHVPVRKAAEFALRNRGGAAEAG
jgi:two-component sensor histidine kinase